MNRRRLSVHIRGSVASVIQFNLMSPRNYVKIPYSAFPILSDNSHCRQAGRDLRHMARNGTTIALVAGISALLIAAGVGTYFVFFADDDSDENGNGNEDIQTVSILLKKGGTETEYTLTELADTLTPISGIGARRKTTGTLVGPFDFKGYLITDLIDLISGISAGDTLISKSSDNYEQTFTFAEVNGEVTCYNSTGGNIGIQNVQMCLLFEQTGAAEVDGGPLRIGFLSAEGYFTDGPLWAKYVVSLEVVSS